MNGIMKAILVTSLINISMALILASGCAPGVEKPLQYTEIPSIATMTPDYRDVFIPPNIAPLNFEILGDSIEGCAAHFVFNGGDFWAGSGRKVLIEDSEWHSMLEQTAGHQFEVELFTKYSGSWRKHPSMMISVATDSIDPYISYRLIPPHNTYERMSLHQRCLENFDDEEFYNNQMLDDVHGGHCVNCHSFQNYRTQRMQIHIRAEYGGTMIIDGDSISKCSLKTKRTISNGVYPAWHPYKNLLVYSTNRSFLLSHSNGLCKTEVQEYESALVLYNLDTREIFPIPKGDSQMETFPTWSPDGKWIYYALANFEFSTPKNTLDDASYVQARINELGENYRKLKYDIYRRSFDTATFVVGDPELVVNASEDSMSASMPRISPDGRYLLTSIGDYGNFHIYHRESDLFLTDLQLTDSASKFVTTRMTGVNSDNSESYHNWSSNGRWIVVQSRRADNNYARLYFSWFDSNGVAHKAFELPQEDPGFEVVNLYAYNVPEFTIEPVRQSSKVIAQAVMDKSPETPTNAEADASTGATVYAGGVN